MEFLSEYGLFLAKTVTLVVAVIVVIGAMVALGSKSRGPGRGHIEVYSLNEGLNAVTRTLKQVVLSESAWKAEAKQQKKDQKKKIKSRQKPKKTCVRMLVSPESSSWISREMCRPVQ